MNGYGPGRPSSGAASSQCYNPGKTLPSVVQHHYATLYLKLNPPPGRNPQLHRTTDWLTCATKLRDQPRSTPHILTMKLVHGWAFFRNQTSNLRGRSSNESQYGCPFCGQPETGPDHLGQCQHTTQTLTRQAHSADRCDLWLQSHLPPEIAAWLVHWERLDEHQRWQTPPPETGASTAVICCKRKGIRTMYVQRGVRL